MLSGYINWYSGNPCNSGAYGLFWVSTPYGYTNSHYLSFTSANVAPKDSYSKPRGYSLRCVALTSRNFPPRSKFFFLYFVSSRALRSLPLSVMMSGILYWGSGTLYDRGTHGLFWTSTPYSYTDSRSLNFVSAGVCPQGGGNKPYAFALRRVAQNPYAIIKIAILMRERSKVLL